MYGVVMDYYQQKVQTIVWGIAPVIDDWWPDGGWRHGEPFPLPLARHYKGRRRLPALLLDAWGCPRAQLRRVDRVVRGINQLASASLNSPVSYGRAVFPSRLDRRVSSRRWWAVSPNRRFGCAVQDKQRALGEESRLKIDQTQV